MFAVSFIKQGVVVLSDAKGALIKLVTGEGNAACDVGAVSFLMGTPPVRLSKVCCLVHACVIMTAHACVS